MIILGVRGDYEFNKNSGALYTKWQCYVTHCSGDYITNRTYWSFLDKLNSSSYS